MLHKRWKNLLMYAWKPWKTVNNIYKKLNRKEISNIQLKESSMKGLFRLYKIYDNLLKDKQDYKILDSNKKIVATFIRQQN